MRNVGKILKKINLPCPVLYDEPMSRHTSFRIGGPADAFLQPRNAEEAVEVFSALMRNAIPTFILGSGANILVSDRGLRAAVVDSGALQGCTIEKTGRVALLASLAGTPISAVSTTALEHGLSGLEFIYSMPGSVGGSVWMNARCYDHSISDVLESVSYVDEEGNLVAMKVDERQFDYKHSPFQHMKTLILRAFFRLKPGDPAQMRARMESIGRDREAKGHFLFPCAGSIFKNNRSFGSPTGKLIDSLGLKGTRIGGARVSERHGNIIVNTGGARAGEVLELIRHLEDRIRESFGFQLEREILLVGEWQEESSC